MPRSRRTARLNRMAHRPWEEVEAEYTARRVRFSAATKAAREMLYASPLAQGMWLLSFSRKDVSGLSEEEKYRLSVELLVFAKGTPMPTRREAPTISESELPSPETLHQANSDARRVFDALGRDGEVDLRTRGWNAAIYLKAGRPWGTVLLEGLSVADAFTMRLYETLADLSSRHGRLQRCANCQEFFIAKRRDSRLCSSSCRTLEWRRANPEKFKKQRQAQYDKTQPVGAKWRRRSA